jgi:hypothetical protein
MAVAIWVFKKAYDAMRVRREIATSVWARMLKPWWSALIWVIYVAPILAALFLVRPHVLVSTKRQVLSLSGVRIYFYVCSFHSGVRA